MKNPLKRTPWSKPDPEREKALENQKIYLEVLRKQAAACLDDEKFVEYKEMYRRYEAETMDSIIYLQEDDPIKYAFKIRQLVDTLKAYRMFISAVEQDARGDWKNLNMKDKKDEVSQ